MTTTTTKPRTLNGLQGLFLLAAAVGAVTLVMGGSTGSATASIVGPLIAMAGYVIIGWQIYRQYASREQFGDSAYYLGFLFTLGALMVSLAALGAGGPADVGPLLARFASALLTTMVGLIARMLIVNLSGASENALEETEHELARQAERYRQELGRMTTGLIAAGYRVQETVATVTEDMAKTSREALERASTAITQGTEQMIAAAAARMESMQQHVEDAFGGLQGAVKEMSATVGGIGNRMRGVKNAAEKVRDGVGAVGESLDLVRERCEGAAESMETVRDLAVALEDVKRRLSGVGSGLDVLTRTLEDSESRHRKFGEAHAQSTQMVREHVERMKQALEQADGMVARVGEEMVAAAEYVRRELAS